MPAKKQKKTPPPLKAAKKSVKNSKTPSRPDHEFLFDLIKLLEAEKIGEFEYSCGDFRVCLKSGSCRQQSAPQAGGELLAGILGSYAPRPETIQPSPSPAAKQPAAPKTAPPPSEDPRAKYIETPITGTFYRAPSPTSPPYVSENQKVRKGQVVCIVEAMKLMNEIKSDFDGTIRSIMIENGATVQAKQKMFCVISD